MRKPVLRVAVASLVTTVTAGAALLGAAPAQARQPAAPLTMTVIDVSPNTPSVTTKPQPLTFTVQLDNTTSKPVDVSISVARGDPIGSTDALDSAVAHPKPPSPSLVSPLSVTKTVTVAPNQPVNVALSTTTATVTPTTGVCLCHKAIYPFWFIGSYTTDGTSGEVTAQTLVPSFTTSPAKSKVSWVWPLLDRPHRLLRSNVFIDDVLADEVASGGRLDRLLQVVERVSSRVPMTLVTDPDLIDELAVMASGHYLVKTSHGMVPGTGAVAAQQWLSRLRLVLQEHPLVRLVFTPFADPAVDSLARAGLTWSVPLDAQARQRVTKALDGRTPPSDVAWPAGRTLAPTTLSQLVTQGGANTVIVGDSALTGGEVSPTPNALAPITTRAGPRATLAVTSGEIERLVARVLDPSVDGLIRLPELVSRLALRNMLDGPRYLVIAPPRDLDVVPDVAVRTIEATADSTWASPITVEDAVTTIPQAARGGLRHIVRGPQLGPHLLGDLRRVSSELPLLITMFHDPTVGSQLAAPVPAAADRAASSSLLNDHASAAAMGQRLTQLVDRTRAAVYIQRPTNGTYTLTSKDSLLPITVVNRLSAEVDVQVSVDAADGGLSSPNTDNSFTIKPNSKVQVHVPLHLNRVGRIKLVARIRTPGGLLLGYGNRETPLSVRSTAIGTIGVVITILAAIALVLAVILRQVRRIRARGRTAPPAQPTPPMATTAPGAQ